MNAEHHWQLNPEIDFLNHGSFGATPSCVLRRQREWRDSLERDPVRFLAIERELEPKLDAVRRDVAGLIGAQPENVAFVRNATDGVNAVLRSFPFDRGDEVVVTDHGYNACVNAATYAARLAGATIRVAKVPFPIRSADEVLEAIDRVMTNRTRLVLVDHVTSPTGIVFPVEAIARRVAQQGARLMVDGAHAPGMLPVNLESLGVDYYTANHHKWLCAPKVSGFLWVKPQWHGEVRPTVISHAANRPRPNRSMFLSEFDWTGTWDPSPLLVVPDAIRFLGSLSEEGIGGLMRRNHDLALASQDVLTRALGIEAPAPAEMLGSLVTVPLPVSDTPPDAAGLDPLQVALHDKHRFELPVFRSPRGLRLMRISLQAYNCLSQIERLAGVLRDELRTER